MIVDYSEIRVRYTKTYAPDIFLKDAYELKYNIERPWNYIKKSKFVEMFIYRIPTFPFYADLSIVGKLSIVHGSNRLLALHEFF